MTLRNIPSEETETGRDGLVKEDKKKKPTTKKNHRFQTTRRSKHVCSFSERSILRSLQHHKILNAENESRSGQKNVHIVQDDFTNWIEGYPMKAKDTLGTITSSQRCRPPSLKLGRLCTDNSKEFIEACQDKTAGGSVRRINKGTADGATELSDGISVLLA